MAITGSIKQMTEARWTAYYTEEGHFYKLFSDYRMLRDIAERRELSSAEEAQKRAIEKLIDGKLS